MIDFDEARKLVHALEKDLARVQSGSEEIQILRNEVEALRDVLQSSEPAHGWVSEALQSIHSTIRDGAETAEFNSMIAGRYVVAIGRMLGL